MQLVGPVKQTPTMKHKLQSTHSVTLSSALRTVLLLGVLAGVMNSVTVVTVNAQTVSPAQSSARPFGLDIVNQVNLRGSDAASADFLQNTLPDVQNLLKTKLSERISVADASALSLDPTKLTLATESTARVYFVGEGAGYHNTLGFNVLDGNQAKPTGAIGDNAQLIFPDASSTQSYYNPSNAGSRSSWNPVLAGDFVDLGTFQAGSTLDFFLIANGANGGKNSYAAPATRNPDGIDHVVSFALPNSPYLIIGFEDLFNGGDRDFNDILFVVDIGEANVQQLVSAPEPSIWLTLGGFLFLGWWIKRRRQQHDAAATNTNS